MHNETAQWFANALEGAMEREDDEEPTGSMSPVRQTDRGMSSGGVSRSGRYASFHTSDSTERRSEAVSDSSGGGSLEMVELGSAKVGSDGKTSYLAMKEDSI